MVEVKCYIPQCKHNIKNLCTLDTIDLWLQEINEESTYEYAACEQFEPIPFKDWCNK